MARSLLTVKNSVVNFETINSEEINVTETDLSKNQQYVINICRTVKTEVCAPDLSAKNYGPLSNFRLLTCATKTLSLYISEVKPSVENCWSVIL